MTVALIHALAKAGLRVDADEFLAMVADAARRLSPADPDPAEYFTAQQREALVDVGLDLSARGSVEVDSRARAVAAQAVLRDTAYPVATAARTLGVDTSRVRHRLAAGRLSGWKDRGGWRLPAWQFTTGGVLPGLETVLRAVPQDQPPLVVAAFMTTPQPDLVLAGRPAPEAGPADERWLTPRQWLLATGDPNPVAALAATLGTLG